MQLGSREKVQAASASSSILWRWIESSEGREMGMGWCFVTCKV